MTHDPRDKDDILSDDGADIGADDWASPTPSHDDDVPVFDRGRGMDSPERLFDDINDYTWG
jgi:hypothetical protein